MTDRKIREMLPAVFAAATLGLMLVWIARWLIGGG
jgi:hypothetical protein